jgi:hypothetical protein
MLFLGGQCVFPVFPVWNCVCLRGVVRVNKRFSHGAVKRAEQAGSFVIKKKYGEILVVAIDKINFFRLKLQE